MSAAAAAEGLGEPLIEAVVRRAPRLLGGRPVHLYEEGFVLVRGARVRRWADVTHWRSTVDVHIKVADERHDIAWYTLGHRHRLRFGDGTEQGFLLDEWQTEVGAADQERPENRRIRSVVDHVRQRVADAQVPALLDRIEAGRQVTFGPLTADAHGVFVPGGRRSTGGPTCGSRVSTSTCPTGRCRRPGGFGRGTPDSPCGARTDTATRTAPRYRPGRS